MTAYEVLRYRPEFRPGLLALRQHLFTREEALNEAYFRWKHEENPYTAEPIAYVALAGGDVVGARSFMGANWWLGDGGSASWLVACDLIVHPGHRGRGLFRRLMAHALRELAGEGHGWMVNWSANPVTYGASLRSGWRLVAPFETRGRQDPGSGRARRLAHRLNRWPIAWRLGSLLLDRALTPAFAGMDAAWARHPAADPLTLGREPMPGPMAALVESRRSQLIEHARDAEYYRWRYRNPLSEYRFLFDRPEGGLEGFLVLQSARDARAADLCIVDWEASRPEVLAGLLTRLVEAGGYDSLSTWTATLPRHTLAVLGRLGFQARDESRGDPAYRPGLLAIGPGGDSTGPGAAAEAPCFVDAARWGFRMAWSDAY